MGRKLGELLVAEGRISQAVLARALELQGTQARGLRLGAILLRWGLVPEKTLLGCLARVHKCPSVDWETLSVATPEAVNLLSAAQSKRLAAVPYAVDKKSVRVAFANPSDLLAIDEVGAITRRRVVVTVTTEVRLLQAQQRFYQRPLSRDVWTILQKMERPAAARPSVSAIPPPKMPLRSTPPRFPRPAPTVSAVAEEKLTVPPPELTPPPPELVPPSLWIEATEESKREVEACPFPAPEASEDAVAFDPTVEDLLEPAPAPPVEPLPVAVESGEEKNVPILRGERSEIVADFENLPLEELLGERLDPFADETPLTEFIEQALAFYAAQPTFRSALNALDDGQVEDLESELEEMAASPAPEAPSTAPSLDSTHPSLRRNRRSEAEPEAAV